MCSFIKLCCGTCVGRKFKWDQDDQVTGNGINKLCGSNIMSTQEYVWQTCEEGTVLQDNGRFYYGTVT